MKKKIIIIMPILIIVIFTSGYLWWSSPIHFLNNTKSSDIIRIEVFNGNTGKDFVIEDYNDINNIVSNIQSLSMRKSKISLGYMGTLFNLTFINTEGKIVDEFTVNHYDTIRKDPFFYTDFTNSLCVDLLNSLENNIEEDD